MVSNAEKTYPRSSRRYGLNLKRNMDVEQKKRNTQVDNQLIPILDTALQKTNKRVKNANYEINIISLHRR